MNWVQTYDPLHQAWLSTLLAAVPIVTLLGLLVSGVKAHWAAAAGLAAALAVALGGYHMPAAAALAAAGYGACFGIMPIGWIVLAAVFLYHLTLRTGQFEIIRRSIARLSSDRRMQALLIAYSFGAFLEGAAGFGAPVAISSALLLGLGFPPLYAAGMALIANTAPVAFGSLGIPIVTLAQYSKMSDFALGQVAGRQLTPFSLLIPFWLVYAMSGWRGIRGCWPALLVSGGTYAVLQLVISNCVGVALVNVVSGLGSMVALALFLRVWKPAQEWRFPDEVAATAAEADAPLPARQVLRAWTPWLLLSLMILVWGLGPVKDWLNGGPAGRPNVLAGISRPEWPVPGLHGRIYRTAPIVPVPAGSDRAEKPEDAIFKLNWLSAAGTAIFLTAVLTAVWLRIGVWTFCRQFLSTLYQIRLALLTIAITMAIANILTYSGCDGTLGLAFARSGRLYPFFAPLLGWLGVAITGSDTSSNALFGSLQAITARQLNLNPLLIVASGSTGGVMGKMIAAPSVVVAAAATGQSGQESRILRFVIVHSLILVVLMGLLTLAQAYVLTWTIPTG